MVNASRLETAPETFLPRSGAPPVAWRVSEGLVAYEAAVAWMEARAAAIARAEADECVWLLEHPPLYTAGTSAKAADHACSSAPAAERFRAALRWLRIRR